jgi:hypothetical protein
MCIILIGKITRQQFNQAKMENQDGFSFFTKETGLVKAPTQEQVDRVLTENLFGIWHFRIGTSGTINKDDITNIHPFPICGNKYLLYHNGVIGSGDATRSDTHCLADTLMNASLETAETVVKALTDGNRFVIVNAEDVNDYRIYGKWECEAGVLMSHKMYNYNYKSYGGHSYGGHFSWQDWDTPSSKLVKPAKDETTELEDVEYEITIDGEKQTIKDTLKAEANLTNKQVMRTWICKHISNLSVSNKNIYYHTKNKDELIGYMFKKDKKLQKNHCKDFTVAFLESFDKDRMDICYWITLKEKDPSATQIGMFDENDDWLI